MDRRSVLSSLALGSALASFAEATAAFADATGDLFVIAELNAKPGSADALRDLIVPFVAKARMEPGCKSYLLLEVENEPGRFLTFETWTDHPALDAHMKTPHLAELGPKLGPVMAKPFTQIFLGSVNGT
jgi:quinol monooxygenase YgiN